MGRRASPIPPNFKERFERMLHEGVLLDRMLEGLGIPTSSPNVLYRMIALTYPGCSTLSEVCRLLNIKTRLGMRQRIKIRRVRKENARPTAYVSPEERTRKIAAESYARLKKITVPEPEVEGFTEDARPDLVVPVRIMTREELDSMPVFPGIIGTDMQRIPGTDLVRIAGREDIFTRKFLRWNKRQTAHLPPPEEDEEI